MGEEKEREEKECKEKDEETFECKCNLPAKKTCGVAVGIILIGVILYVAGVIQASVMFSKTVIVDGQTEFSLLVPPSEYSDTYETLEAQNLHFLHG